MEAKNGGGDSPLLATDARPLDQLRPIMFAHER